MPCSEDKNCEAMQLAIDSKAVERSIIMNVKTGKARTVSGVRVKYKGKKRTLFFTACPWCLTPEPTGE